MRRLTIFLDDGGVMNDNSLRGPQWQRLVGEFFIPLLGGTAPAWAEANRAVAEAQWEDYRRTVASAPWFDQHVYLRRYDIVWLRSMCKRMGISAPVSDDATLDLARRAVDHITRRVRFAFPDAADAVRALYSADHTLHTASNKPSWELAGYLDGMGVRDCFTRLYGTELVNAPKSSPGFYSRIFADADVRPDEALVVDDSPQAVAWAAAAGARTALIGSAPAGCPPPDLVVPILADLPTALATFDMH